MSDVIKIKSECRLCGGSDLELALPMRPSPIGDAYITKEELENMQNCYPLELHLCKQCKHLQSIYVIDPVILFGNYIYSTSTSPGLVEHFRLYADEVIKYVERDSNSLVVEFGSNDGSLLKAFKQHGVNVLGVDPAKDIAEKATSDGIETWATFFSLTTAKQIKEKHGSAQIIAANNVFAHIDNMADIVKGIEYLLADDGVFVFEVSYLVDMIDKNVFDTIYHEHLCHHRIEPLEQFFNQHGMQLFNVERISTKGGSIRGFAKLSSSARKVEPIVQQLIELEKNMKLGELETYTQFHARLNAVQDKLMKQLNHYKLNGCSIAGFGASTPMTTMIYQFELGQYLDYLIDDNPIKQGRFSPGHHLPVFSSDVICRKKPDCIVILAWQYADLIIEKHKDYLAEGGCFIAPLPEPKIYSTRSVNLTA